VTARLSKLNGANPCRSLFADGRTTTARSISSLWARIQTLLTGHRLDDLRL
jgi:hypothetical protein